MSGFLLPALTLAQREITRFYRQRSRVAGAILPPVLFWFLIGSGLGGSFHYKEGMIPPPAGGALLSRFTGSAGGGMNYLQYFFPGTVVMIVLFTAIFSTISIIEDRKEGFLQSVLVAPVPRLSIALGKILGGSILAFLEGLVFVLLAPLVGASFDFIPVLYVFLMLFMVAFGLTGLGFLIAWQMDSTQGFHAIMNLFLMPMWFLSGALFPMETAPKWLRVLMVCDPLSYSVAALRGGLYPSNLGRSASFPTPGLSLLVTALFCGITFSASAWICSRKETI